MTSFDTLGLSERALEAVGLLGYAEPTPVQEQAIPLALSGRDVIAAAKPGTGKTAAFSLPLLDRIGYAKGGQGPLVLIITPTRELAQQIGEVCGRIAEASHHRILTVVGGLSYTPQIDRLKRGTDVLIATPGRLIDLMDQDAVRLGDVQALVLDEADRMLDMGFIHDIKRILPKLPKEKQTLFFSATMPDSIVTLASALLKNPVKITITPESPTVDAIEQFVYFVEKAEKGRLLISLLRKAENQSVLVFSRTKHNADRIVRVLGKAGIGSQAIHGNKSQAARQSALGNFKSGKTRVMVATDIAARGIDINELPLVINYDLPDVPETYVHRIGRTGRAGNAGTAFTFCSQEERKLVDNIQKLTGKKLCRAEVSA